MGGYKSLDDLFAQFSYNPYGEKEFQNEETKKAYKEASGVDIDSERKIGDERAKGYVGEYKVFSTLFTELDFPNKILVNVQIPTADGRKTEIDLVLISLTGIYVFEVKHYRGAVYGRYDSPTWTSYYKSRDSVTFDNPLKQNEYHLSQLRKLFPKAVFYSYVVFTNSDAKIRVAGQYPGNLTVTRISDLLEKIRGDFAAREAIYTPEQIEGFFRRLRKYSPLETNAKEYFNKDNENLPFSSFSDAMLRDLEDAKRISRKAAEYELQRRTEMLNKEKEEVQSLGNRYRGMIQAAETERDAAVRDLEEFKRNFVNVTPFMSDYGVINRDCFSADVEFEKSDSFEHTTNMYFTFHNKSTDLWINIKDGWFIVGLKNGKVQQYALRPHIRDNFDMESVISNKKSSKRWKMRIFKAYPEEINFIKLCHVRVSDESWLRNDVAPGVEFEIYAAPGVETIYEKEEVQQVLDKNGGAFELKPNFLQTEVALELSSDGEGCDIRCCFSAGTAEVGFDLSRASFVIGTKDGSIKEYGLTKHLRGFYSTTVSPLKKTNSHTMHLDGVKDEDIVFIKLKNPRVFRAELWSSDNLLPNVEIDIYPKVDEGSN